MLKVSVVMAVHNGENYLRSALRSVLDQSFRDFEFIVVDDGSTDSSLNILENESDKRLRFLSNSEAKGLPYSLNRAIAAASGEYIARMDHDDVSLPRRIAAQASFLDNELNTDLVGCWAETIGDGRKQIWRYATKHDQIHSELIFSPTLVHSSVMWRRKRFEDLQLKYNSEMKRTQDFDLWVRAAESGIRFANIPQVLIKYRIHPNQVGKQFSGEQQRGADLVRERQVRSLGLQPSETELQLHHEVSRWHFPRNLGDLQRLEDWLVLLRSANIQKKVYETKSFSEALEKRWWAACRSNISLGLAAWRLYSASRLATNSHSLREKAFFWGKSWLRNSRSNLR